MKLNRFNTFLNESTQDDGMMNDEEIYEEVIDRITKLKNNTNQWATRDTDELLEYVKQWRPGYPNIEEVYDDLYNY